jgi:hypothetical protein
MCTAGFIRTKQLLVSALCCCVTSAVCCWHAGAACTHSQPHGVVFVCTAGPCHQAPNKRAAAVCLLLGLPRLLAVRARNLAAGTSQHTMPFLIASAACCVPAGAARLHSQPHSVVFICAADPATKQPSISVPSCLFYFGLPLLLAVCMQIQTAGTSHHTMPFLIASAACCVPAGAACPDSQPYRDASICAARPGHQAAICLCAQLIGFYLCCRCCWLCACDFRQLEPAITQGPF